MTMLYALKIVALSLLTLTSFNNVLAINCYTCSSYNGSNPNCEDPFNPAMSTYTEKCMVPKQGHIGKFPANFCIKIDGRNVETKEVMFIRACVMKTMDSQCGGFRYQDTVMTGCIQSCDYDGCNRAAGLIRISSMWSLLIHFTVVTTIFKIT